MGGGSLTVVGTGIRLITQLTPEARAAIEQTEKVLYIATDPVAARWLPALNASAESLHNLYQLGRERRATYEDMIERVLSPVRGGAHVGFVLYGHPGVLAYPSHEAIRRARREGFHARMLPGISAEACLFADLGVDPGGCGCQSFEASDFLVHRRGFDPRSVLILWQVAVIGQSAHTLALPNRRGLRVLAARLSEHYPSDHPAILYEAAEYPGCLPDIVHVTIAALPEAAVSASSTLYVTPLDSGPPDRAVLDALGPE